MIKIPVDVNVKDRIPVIIYQQKTEFQSSVNDKCPHFCQKLSINEQIPVKS